MELQGFSLEAACGVPIIKAEDQMNPEFLSMYPTADTKSVLQECNFLNHCKTNQSKISEPEWFAAISILGRLENGRKLAHQYSKEYHGYSPEETDAKLEHALKSAGPRTCNNISTLWSGCSSCLYWNKIKSPIQIKGATFITTAKTGFRQMIVDGSGNARPGKIAYEDLSKQYSQDFLHRTIAETDTLMIYNSTEGMWSEQISKYQIAYAHEKINPKPKKSETDEFCHFIRRENLVPHQTWLDSTAGKLNLLNGVYDISKNQLSAHSPSLFFTYRVNYSFDPSATAPTIQSFLNAITCDNPEYIEILLQFFAYALFDSSYSLHKALCLIGSGSNGKSTLLELIRYIFGISSCAEIPIAKLMDPVYAYQLQNKKINLSEETASNSLLSSDTFKLATSGGHLQMKRLYENTFSIRNNTKFIFASNHPPQIKDSSYGMLRRLLIIPFDAVFKGSDIKLNYADELKSEAPGFLNMLIAAYSRLIEQGHFTVSNSQDELLAELSESGDSIVAWYKARVEVYEPDSKLKSFTDDLYENFRSFASQVGQAHIPTLSTFGQRLSTQIPNYSIRKFSTGSRRGIRGICIKGVQ
jgi:P4 family phage/plasmid primase-like protien